MTFPHRITAALPGGYYLAKSLARRLAVRVVSRRPVIASWTESAPFDTLPGARRAAPRPPPRRGIVETAGIGGPVQDVRGDTERRGQPASPRGQGAVRHPARGTPSRPLDLAIVK